MKRLLALALCGSFGLAAASASPTLIFSDDFSNPDPDGRPSRDLWGENAYQQRGNEANQYIRVTSDNSEGYFGEPGNNYLVLYADGTDSNSMWLTANTKLAGSNVVSVHLDFYRSSSAPTGPTMRLGVSDPIQANNNRTRYQFRFDQDGLSGAKSQVKDNRAYHLQMVYNNSPEAVTYLDGAATVMPDSYDVWIDGVRVMTSVRHGFFNSVNCPLGAAMTSFGIGIIGAAQNELRIDNLKIYDGAYAEGVVAGVVAFADDFSNPTAAGNPSFAIWNRDPANEFESNRIIEVTSLNSETYFGEPGNNYLRFYHDGTTTGNLHMTGATRFNPVSDTVTISFDFYENPSLGENNFVIRTGTGTVGNSDRIHEVTFNKGSLSGVEGLYEPGVKNNVQIVMNNSPYPVPYLGGAAVVASDTYDVWLNGRRVLNDHTLGRGGLALGTALASIQLVIWADGSNEFLIDNLRVYTHPFVVGAGVPGGLTFAQWAASLPEEARGPLDNPAGDGVSNLIKFALGLDPLVPVREGLPYPETVLEEGQQYLSILFQRSTEAVGVRIRLQASPNLVDWNEIPGNFQVIDSAGGLELIRARDIEAVGNSPRRFLRLAVELE
jgi:hypothetical protein